MDVILNAGEAGVRDLRYMDQSMKLTGKVSAASTTTKTAEIVHIFVRSLGGLSPFSG